MSSIAAIEQPKGLVGTWGAIVLFPILFVHGLIRLWLVLEEAVPFNADEAVVALMARHIIQSHDIPKFFYGQEYMGSLDAILVAIGFQIFGEKVAVIRMIQFILYCLWAITTYLLILSISKSKILAWIGSMFFVVPTVNVILYTTVSLGGYGEALVLGNCVLLVGIAIRKNQVNFSMQAAFRWFVLGFLIGFGFWVFGLTLVYSVAVILFLIYSIIKDHTQGKLIKYAKYLSVAFLGFLIGAIPIFDYLMTHSETAVIGELLGSAIASDSRGILLVNEIATRFFSFVFLGIPVTLGIRPPWSVEWLVLPLIPGVIFFWIAAFFILKREGDRLGIFTSGGELIILMGLVTILGFLLTPFGNDPSGRYFLPLYLPMVVIGSLFVMMISTRWRQLIWILPLFLVTYNFLAVMQINHNNPPGLTTQFDRVAQIDHREIDSLIDFLEENDITRGYSNYWVAYPLAFLSHEELIFAPSLPYHEDFRYTTRDRRYPPYDMIVENSPNVAYITTNHPDLDNYLRMMFAQLNLDWKEIQIGDYHLFYELSSAVHAAEIGLGVDRE